MLDNTCYIHTVFFFMHCESYLGNFICVFLNILCKRERRVYNLRINYIFNELLNANFNFIFFNYEVISAKRKLCG